MKTRYTFGIAAAAVLLFAALLVPLFSNSPASAAPGAIPAAAVTPVAGVVHSGVAGAVLTFMSTEVITSDGCSALQNIQDHAKVDMQWVIDQGTTNTTTYSLRWTNTGSKDNLITDVTLVSANTADATAGGQFSLFGRQACVYHDVSNTNPVTVTFIGVAK